LVLVSFLILFSVDMRRVPRLDVPLEVSASHEDLTTKVTSETAILFYFTDSVNASFRPFRVTEGSATFTAIPFYRVSGSTRFSSMYFCQY